MSVRVVLHIVPHLPPEPDAIREYAARLSSGLHELGVESRLTGLGDCGSDLEGFVAQYGLVGGDPVRLAATLSKVNSSVVLLHANGYGYAKRGAPFWLAEGLKRWKGRASDRRLAVMFHELWASGPPWRSSFWMNGLQRHVVRLLFDLADVCFTNTAVHASRLRCLGGPNKIAAVLPVMSNVGECARPRPFLERELIAVVFGQAAQRRLMFARLHQFVPLLQQLGITRIVDVGAPVQLPAFRDITVESLGYLSAGRVSALLSRARVGLLTYDHDSLAKSSILAAYAAHGVIPVIFGKAEGDADGLVDGVNLLRVCEGSTLPDNPKLAEMVEQIFYWYTDHNQFNTARIFRDNLFVQTAVYAGCIEQLGVREEDLRRKM